MIGPDGRRAAGNGAPAANSAAPAADSAAPAANSAAPAANSAAPAANSAAPAAPGPHPRSPLARLLAEPELFDLDQAAFVAAAGRRAEDLPFAAPPRLGLPLAEVTRAEAGPDGRVARIETPLFGLVGPMGTLPRHHTASAAAARRRRDGAEADLLDLLARRFTGMWVRAGAKHAPHRDPGASVALALDAAVGLGTAHLAARLPLPADAPRHHAGHLAARTASAARLADLLSGEAGAPVEVEEFAGGWERIPEAERTRLGAAHARLGEGAVAGAQIWDPSARVVLRLGPLDGAGFAALLPGEPLFARLCALARLHLGPEVGFLLNPVLAAAAVPHARLAAPGEAAPGEAGPGEAGPGVAAPGVAAPGVAAPGVAAPGVAGPGEAVPGPRPGSRSGGASPAGPRLGRTAWLAAPRPRAADAGDARLPPPPFA